MSMVAQHQIDTRLAGRLNDRHNVLIGVKLRRPGETWFTSRVTDLSVTGFRLQSFVKLSTGMELWVMLPGFEGRKSRVLWSRGHEAGCAFDRPLHQAIFEHIVRMTKLRPIEGSKL